MALTPRGAPSRIAAIGLLIAVMAVFGLGLGIPLAREYRLTIAEVERYRDALDGYRRIAARATDLRRGIETLERDRSLEQALLPSGSDSAATAAIQDRVQSIIGDAGAWLTSVQPLPASLDDGYRRMGLRVAFATDINALRTILYGLEHGLYGLEQRQPAMILDNVYIHARTSRAVGVAYPLEVRIDVFAFKPDSA